MGSYTGSLVTYPLTKHKRVKFVVPKSQKPEVLSDVHDNAGHQGQPCILSLVLPLVWHGELHNYVRNCHRCNLSKTPEPAARAPLESITTSTPLELVCIDFWSAEDSNKSVDVQVIAYHFTMLMHSIAKIKHLRGWPWSFGWLLFHLWFL